MNFMTDLLKNKDYNAVLIVINRLIKMRYYIIYKVREEEISAE